MLDRDAILGAFERLAALLRERGVEGEVCLLGGTEVLGIVARYYPEDRVPPRAVYLLEDLFAAKERRP